MLTNLMFETIGSTTYRLALRRAKHPTVRQMLTILTRDESFHVPLNVHFIREILQHERRAHAARDSRPSTTWSSWRSSPAVAASREVAQDFDHISWRSCRPRTSRTSVGSS